MDLHAGAQPIAFGYVDDVAQGVSLSLDGKVVLVTGGSRGIGAATVRLFRQAGARVVFSYRSAETQARELVEACGGEEFCRAVRQELAYGGGWAGVGGGGGGGLGAGGLFGGESWDLAAA